MSALPKFLPARKVIPRADVAAILEGTSLIAQAQEVLLDAKKRTAGEIGDARRQGARKGFAVGTTTALSAFGPAVREARAKLALAESELAAIVIAAVEKIIGTMDDRELARRCLAVALEEAKQEIAVTVYVPPAALATVRHIVDDINAASPVAGLRSVVADPLLLEGEMVIEIPKGRVHIGVRQQLGRLRAALADVQP